MRTLVTFLMAGVLLGQHVFNLAQVVHYALEYDHYVNVLCENRDRPELRCNGACHLKKELADVPESEAPALPEIESTTLWMVAAYPEACMDFPEEIVGGTALRVGDEGAVCSGWLRRVEHPPGMGLHLC